jgi:chemotaxis protein MotB
MRQSQRGNKTGEIIIKRRAKKGHAQEHGGAWKVAFADFTMAMMALFMVLWVITPQNLAQTVAADKDSNPLVDGGAGIFDGTNRQPLDFEGLPKPRVERQESSDLQDLATLLKTLSVQLDAEANLEVQVVPQGLRILIKDDQQRFMFERGSARLNTDFEVLLTRLAGVIAQVDNKIIISGHTDAIPYPGDARYNNWNLSGDRALRARNVMVAAGLPARTVLQVTAQADGMPLLPDAPEDGANRRIEILLLTLQAEGLYRELFGDRQLRADYSAEGAELVSPVGT